jgi:hypothetical protein
MMSLSALMIVPAVGGIALLGLVGVGLQRMVVARSRLRRDLRQREEAKLHAARVRDMLQSQLRPLGMRRITLEHFRQPPAIHHRRRLNLHVRLD